MRKAVPKMEMTLTSRVLGARSRMPRRIETHAEPWEVSQLMMKGMELSLGKLLAMLQNGLMVWTVLKARWIQMTRSLTWNRH